MEDKIDVSLSRIQEIIDEKLENIFTTADVLREYSGGFYSNLHTAAFYSFNAQFGKLLKRNALILHITEVESNVDIKDDNGHKTTTSRWEKM